MGWTVVGWLVSGLVGALAATLIQVWLHRKYDQRERRRNVLARIAGNRHFLTSNVNVSEAEPYISMNEIFIVFADFPNVISAVKKFHQELKVPARLEDNLLTLIKAMATASDVRIKNLNDDFIVRPFAPGPGASRRQP